MSDNQPHVPTQPVEYLAVSEGLLGHPTTGEPVVIISLRPNPRNFAFINIAIPVEQAWRLAADIQGLLLPFVLLVSVLATSGCGGRVEMESAKWGSSSGERSATSVEVDVLHTRPPEPVAKPKATEPPPTPAASEAKPPNISGNTIILSIRGGDTYYHSETHVHLDAPPAPKVEERIVIQREIRVEPPRRVNERCERLAREHEERVRKWREFPGGY